MGKTKEIRLTVKESERLRANGPATYQGKRKPGRGRGRRITTVVRCQVSVDISIEQG